MIAQNYLDALTKSSWKWPAQNSSKSLLKVSLIALEQNIKFIKEQKLTLGLCGYLIKDSKRVLSHQLFFGEKHTELKGKKISSFRYCRFIIPNFAGFVNKKFKCLMKYKFSLGGMQTEKTQNHIYTKTHCSVIHEKL